MRKYCFIEDEESGLVQLGIGCPDEYYIEIGMELRDVEQSDIDNQWYLAEKCPHLTPEEKLQNAKREKIIENDEKRDLALIAGVTYKNILFDSDTDQKVNLLDTVDTMADGDTIIWFGMNNEPLECTKFDLNAIGELIRTLHKFCWAHNAEIKKAIKEATTEEELNAIDIDYTIPAVTE
ncbi:DUF4376 domain-containing protein [bacterium]|nr:DUF4376 domain-containing protein [bacterium]